MIVPLLLVALGCEVVEPGKPAASSPTLTAKQSSDKSVEPAPQAVPREEKEKKVSRSEDEWREILSPEEYRVLRQKGTERAFTGEYDKHFEPGAYTCAACGSVLFESDTKFNSGCGWPAFYAAKAGDRVTQTADHSLGMVRTEVTCSRCDSHLGHIFDDSPQTPTGQRYCINSVALKFIPQSELNARSDRAQDASAVVDDTANDAADDGNSNTSG